MGFKNFMKRVANCFLLDDFKFKDVENYEDKDFLPQKKLNQKKQNNVKKIFIYLISIISGIILISLPLAIYFGYQVKIIPSQTIWSDEAKSNQIIAQTKVTPEYNYTYSGYDFYIQGSQQLINISENVIENVKIRLYIYSMDGRHESDYIVHSFNPGEVLNVSIKYYPKDRDYSMKDPGFEISINDGYFERVKMFTPTIISEQHIFPVCFYIFIGIIIISFISLLSYILFLYKKYIEKINLKKSTIEKLKNEISFYQRNIAEIENAIVSKNLNSLMMLDGLEFEKWCSSLFKSLGYSVYITPASGDYGADLILNDYISVQCKLYSGIVGVKSVMEVNASKGHYNTEEAWVITNSYFTKQAKILAEELNVRLIDKDILKYYILQANEEDKAELNHLNKSIKKLEGEKIKVEKEVIKFLE